MIKNIVKTIGVLLALDIVFFLGMIATAMTDEKPKSIGKVFYWILKYILGFPMVLVNNDYPFFLDSGRISITGIFLIVFNNIILAFAIWGISKAFK